MIKVSVSVMGHECGSLLRTAKRACTSLAMCCVLAATATAASKQLDARHLLPSPPYDSGSGVADTDTWIEPVNPAATFRNLEEIFPTRKIASGAWVSPLNAPSSPFEVRYSVGGESHGIAEFAARTDTTGLLILKSDRIMFEGYYRGADQNDLFMSFSTGKSFVSTLVGLALGEGKIRSLDDRMAEYLPEVKGSAYEAATIRNVLEMSSGTSYSEDYEDPKSDFRGFAAAVSKGRGGLYDFCRSFKAAIPPGQEFRYATCNTEMLGALVARVTGVSVSTYLSEKLWKPLGAEAPARWLLDRPGAAGREMSGGGLQVRLRDYGRFGLLFANQGEWHGRQLLPKGWVEEATRPNGAQVQYGRLEKGYPLGYGYQWWLLPGEHHPFTAQGVHGQFVMVDPVEKVVVVKLSSWQRAWESDKEAETYAFFNAVVEALHGR
jgi:CubicO group peptidase (beta-lactamase class C family)